MTQDYKSSAEVLKDIRLKSGLNQVQLSKKLRISNQMIASWEQGKIFIPIDRIRQILKFTKCSEEDREKLVAVYLHDRMIKDLFRIINAVN